MRVLFYCLAAGSLFPDGLSARDWPTPKIVEVKRIWDRAPHNAFTDLLFHNERWYCVFREGRRHVSPDGSLRVIVSKDGDEWTPLSLITHPVEDLRDAKISVTPDGRLMLNGAGMIADAKIRYHSMVWFSDDQGKTWSKEKRIGDPGDWLWRVHWQKGMCYSMGYGTDRDRTKRKATFYRSADGTNYEKLIPELNLEKGAGEDRILFLQDDSALCLFRHETGNKLAFLGKSQPPYNHWTWTNLNYQIGGPNMIQLPDGAIIAATRLYDGKTRTSLSWLDPEKGRLTECLTLPSGGDTGYPGLVWKDDLLWISYYSSHEGKTAIYLAKVAFDSPELIRGKEPWEILKPHFSVPERFRDDYGDYPSPSREGNWAQRRQEIRREWTGLLGEWPPLITEPEVEILDTWNREGITQYKIRFHWLPDQPTSAYLLVPPGSGKRPAVVTVYYEPETSAGLNDKEFRNFAWQLARRGFVTLSIGTTETTGNKTYSLYYPEINHSTVQPLSALACAAANAWHVLANRPEVNPDRIGIMGHSYGGKWAMFAGCLFDRFAAVAVSDPGIMIDTHPSVNYWEPWYLGWHPHPRRQRGIITGENPARGLYPRLLKEGRDLHELHALLAPRPFFVSGGAVDPPDRWKALNHLVKINESLGFKNRVGMTNRPEHSPNAVSNAAIYAFFEHFLGQE